MREQLRSIEEIEKYLQGSMSAAEQLEFQAKIDASATLAEEVRLHQQITERIKVDAFKQDVSNFAIASGTGGGSGGTSGGFSITNFFNMNSLLLAITGGIATLMIFLAVSTSKEEATNKASENLASESVYKFADQEPLQYSSFAYQPALNSGDEQFRNFFPSDFIQEEERIKLYIPKDFAVQPTQVSLKVSKGGNFLMPRSGSTVTIPPHAIVDKNGVPVEGKIDIAYREFRSMGEQAFSGIPMAYNQAGEDMLFKSAGMFEIKAYKDNEEVFLDSSKNIVVDYQLTKNMQNTSFYELNENTGEWKSLVEIGTGREGAMFGKHEFVDAGELVLAGNHKDVHVKEFIKKNMKYPYYAAYNKIEGLVEVSFRLNSEGEVWDLVVERSRNKHLDKATVFLAGQIAKVKEKSFKKFNRKTRYKISIDYNMKSANSQKIEPIADMVYEHKLDKIDVVHRGDFQTAEDRANKVKANFSASRKKNMVGPALNIGLRFNSFGVFNCDVLTRLQNRKEFVPNFYTNRNKLKNDFITVSVVNLSLGTSYNQSPSSIWLDSQANNMLILADTAKTVYAVYWDEIKTGINAAGNGPRPFHLVEITKHMQDLETFSYFLSQCRYKSQQKNDVETASN